MNLCSLIKYFAPAKPFIDPVCNDNCEFEIDNWLVSRFVLERLLPHVGFHPFPLNEQMLMTAAVCRLKPTHILEWGTNIGASARIFHEICREFSVSAEIHSIDLPDHEHHGEHPGQQRGFLVRGIPEVQLHQGDGCDVALSVLGKSSVPVRPLFFLDGDHSYASVRRELMLITSTIPEASILVHDTFYQTEVSGYNIGPWRAIRDMLQETGACYERYDQNLGLPGMTLLWKRL